MVCSVDTDSAGLAQVGDREMVLGLSLGSPDWKRTESSEEDLRPDLQTIQCTIHKVNENQKKRH